MSETTRKVLTRPVLNKAKSVAKSAAKPNAKSKTKFNTDSRSTSAPPTPLAVNEIATLAIKPDSLAYSLVGAAQAVAYVLEGMALPQALSRVFTQNELNPQARGAVQDIAYRTMRQVGRVDALIKAMTSKLPEPPLLYSLLCCALTLLVTENPEDAPYDDFVVVDQAVNAAASSTQMVFAKGMVNAVLRRFLREKTQLLALVMKQPAAMWNYPQWWVDQCKAAYPEQWQAIGVGLDFVPGRQRR